MSEVRRIARGKLDHSVDKEFDNVVKNVPVRDSSKAITVKNHIELLSFDASSVSLDELANVVGTLIAKLKATGVLKDG